MKGQAFLIIATIFIIILALMKASISFFQFKEDKSFFLEFENVKEEIRKSVEFSINQKENITKNLEAFAEFSRNSFKRRTLSLKLFFLVGILENNELNLSLKNLLGNEILFLNLSLNHSFKNFENIKDGEKIIASFLIPNQNSNYKLEIFYEMPYSKEKEEILLEVNEKGKLLLFIDISLENQNLKLRDKILKVYEI